MPVLGVQAAIGIPVRFLAHVGSLTGLAARATYGEPLGCKPVILPVVLEYFF